MEEALKLYDEKISILNEMLRVTKNAKINGVSENADDEAEDYIALMEKRKGFLEKILLIDEKLKDKHITEDGRINEKINQVKEIAKEIFELDQKHSKIAVELMNHIKKNIKEINNGKNLNNLYNNEYFDGSLFDQRK